MTQDTRDQVDLTLRDALSKAITQESFFPLVAAPRTGEGLFAKRSSAEKKAIEICLDSANPLLTVKKAEEVNAESAKSVKLVRIKEKGVERLVDLTPVNELPALITSASAAWKARVLNHCLRSIVKRSKEHSDSATRMAIKACFDAAQIYLEDLAIRMNQIVDSQRAIAEAVQSFTKSIAATFTKQSKRLSDEGNLLAEACLQLVTPTTDQTATSTCRDIGWERLQLGRANEAEASIDFQRSLSQEIVFAWQDTVSPEARASLERALFNVGVQKLGETGDRVVFDGSVHRTEEDLIPGDPAEVAEPGWQFVSKRGTFLLAPTRVRKTPPTTAE